MENNKTSTMIATLNANLNPNAEIYKELRKQPDWWLKLLAIKGVYVEIRKDDIVDVYYEGGRMAELRYKNQKLVATCHPKYLGKTVPQGTNPKYEDCFELLKNDPEFIIKEIKKNYSQKGEKDKEDVSEKKIQGDMICSRNPIYLDSEFAHRYEVGNQQTIRFDLVTIRDNELLFIELKRIKDNRLLNKDDDNPKILQQMDKYTEFIKANNDKLIDYYTKLYEIKKSLGLPVPQCNIKKLSICESPHLIIKENYNKYTPERLCRLKRIQSILDTASFTYSIKLDMTFEKAQQIKQIQFRESITDKGFTYILDDSERHLNLFNYQNKESVQKVKDYFANHQIKWWTCCFDAPKGVEPDGKSITRHLVSSQVACINHLFFIKHDKEAVLSIINGIKGMPVKFKEVLNIPCDKGENNYIAFEVIASQDYLHEKILKRGECCTSVDAFVYAVDENNERWLIPIEWKYTETYDREDKSAGFKGRTRLSRYCNLEGDNLIRNSKQLKSLDDYKHSIYFQEPFHQLMRQTLWAECICSNHNEKILPAKHFVHIHVCPKENKELLNKHYVEVTKKSTMEEAWREMLTDQSLYHLIDPKDLMEPIAKKYPDLYNYLKKRYW